MEPLNVNPLVFLLIVLALNFAPRLIWPGNRTAYQLGGIASLTFSLVALGAVLWALTISIGGW